MVFQKHDSNEDLAYWLSNSSTLLIMLQKSLKAVGSSGTSPQKRPQTQTSFLGRMVCFVPCLLNFSHSQECLFAVVLDCICVGCFGMGLLYSLALGLALYICNMYTINNQGFIFPLPTAGLSILSELKSCFVLNKNFHQTRSEGTMCNCISRLLETK
jgi:hypothetical protein